MKGKNYTKIGVMSHNGTVRATYRYFSLEIQGRKKWERVDPYD